MEQTNNTNNSANNQPVNTNPDAGERTFTQEDVNRIVSDRLARERDKRAAELDEREKTLRQRELAVIAREKLEEAGLNKELCKVLRYDDEKSLDEAIAQLKSIQGFKPEKKDKEERIYIPNRLPEIDYSVQDNGNLQLRKAMGLK